MWNNLALPDVHQNCGTATCNGNIAVAGQANYPNSPDVQVTLQNKLLMDQAMICLCASDLEPPVKHFAHWAHTSVAAIKCHAPADGDACTMLQSKACSMCNASAVRHVPCCGRFSCAVYAQGVYLTACTLGDLASPADDPMACSRTSNQLQ